MTSIPPLKPGKSVQPPARTASPQGTDPQNSSEQSPRPEAVVLLVKLMALIVVLELGHQVLSSIITYLNFDIVQAAALQTAAEGSSAIPDALVRASSWLGFGLSTVIALLIIGVLAWAVNTFNKKGKYVAGARRLLFIFSLYFGFRTVMVFMTRPVAASHAPDWLFALDGVVQILVGVAAILCVVFASRTDTLEYTGEMEKLRELEKEQKKLMEQRDREKREKKATKNASKQSGNAPSMDDADFGTFKGMLKRWRSGDSSESKNQGTKNNDAKNNDVKTNDAENNKKS